MRKEYKILIGRPEESTPLERTKHRLEDYVEIGLEKLGLIGFI